MGTYPEVSLLDARERLLETRKAIAQGIAGQLLQNQTSLQTC